jgi:hypothetical protein
MRRVTVIDKYRAGTDTATQVTNAEGAKISDLGK